MIGTDMAGPVSAVIVGAGHRSLLYASYARLHPERLAIAGVVDPDPVRRRHAAASFGLSGEACFETVEQLAAGPRIAEAAINGTMDAVHVPSTIPLLRAGYHVLLEKPIGTNQDEVLRLLEESRASGRKVMICHVLRYAPFYAAIRKLVLEGEIGDLIHIRTEENVSYHHMAMAFVRGKWSNRERCGSSILMAKCCHDLDIITWMKGGTRPVKTASFGNLFQFRPERAPEGSGTRCLTDCLIEESCPYSCKKNYVEQGLWADYIWHGLESVTLTPTEEQKLASLRTDNPYGRCVWQCDNDVVDHQTVMIEFADGSTASHTLTGATAKPCRTIHLVGTKGEITGVMEDGFFVVRHPDARNGHEFSERTVTIDVSGEMHGGGDLRLVEDFIQVVRGREPSISSTTLEDSIYGHLIGFTADRARLEDRSLRIAAL